MYFSFLLFTSWILVAFGQPAWSPYLGVLASAFGFGLFWLVLIPIHEAKKRFWISFVWFAAVQMIQLSWMLLHPYSYIYGVYAFFITALALQFAVIGLFITKERIESYASILGIAGLFVLLEWSRLFFLSGFTFNPVGLLLSGTIYGMQSASLFGVYGLSFLVVLSSLLFLRAITLKFASDWIVWGVFIFLPYIFGFWQIFQHQGGIENAKNKTSSVLNVALVQTAFPIEEIMHFDSLDHSIQFVENEWNEIFKLLKPYSSEKMDLIALPEYVVPYGTYMAIFPLEGIRNKIEAIFGQQGMKALPVLDEPLAFEVETKKGKVWHVTNAYICQALANIFQTDLIVGLQDDQWVVDHEVQSFSSAYYFWPGGSRGLRYEKRVLLPMAEYIPLDFVKAIAQEYGITGSFTPGAGAKVFPGCKVPFGLSICYEETYGDLTRENRQKGAEVLINLTSDVWYPNSRLPKQHFDHARLRSVESGIPLIRACNTGVTCTLDSLGRIIDSLGLDAEWERTVLVSKVPLYSYFTLYTKTGDKPVIALSLIFSFILLPWEFLRKST